MARRLRQPVFLSGQIYISKISTMFAITKWSQDQCTRDNVSKVERKEKIQKSSLHPSYTLPLSQKSSMLTLPLMYDYSHIKTTPPFFTRVTKGKYIK